MIRTIPVTTLPKVLINFAVCILDFSFLFCFIGIIWATKINRRDLIHSPRPFPSSNTTINAPLYIHTPLCLNQSLSCGHKSGGLPQSILDTMTALYSKSGFYGNSSFSPAVTQFFSASLTRFPAGDQDFILLLFSSSSPSPALCSPARLCEAFYKAAVSCSGSGTSLPLSLFKSGDRCSRGHGPLTATGCFSFCFPSILGFIAAHWPLRLFLNIMFLFAYSFIHFMHSFNFYELKSVFLGENHRCTQTHSSRIVFTYDSNHLFSSLMLITLDDSYPETTKKKT